MALSFSLYLIRNRFHHHTHHIHLHHHHHMFFFLQAFWGQEQEQELSSHLLHSLALLLPWEGKGDGKVIRNESWNYCPS